MMRSKKHIVFFMALLVLISVFSFSCVPAVTDPADTTEPVDNPEDSPLPISYDTLLAKYTELLTCKKQGSEFPPREGEKDSEKALFDVLYQVVNNCKAPLDMGYSTKDINGDGSKELVLMERDMTVRALFTVCDGKIASLIDPNGTTAITGAGTVYHSSELNGGLHPGSRSRRSSEVSLRGLNSA